MENRKKGVRVAGGVPIEGDVMALTVTPRDVAYGMAVDELRKKIDALREAEALRRAENSPMRKALEAARRKEDHEASMAAKIGSPEMKPADNFVTQEQLAKDFETRFSRGMVAAPAAAATAMAAPGLISRYGPTAAKLLMEGSKSPAAIVTGGAINAATELLEDQPNWLRAGAKGVEGASGMRFPLPTIAAYVPETEAAPVSLKPLAKGLAQTVEKYLPSEKQLYREALAKQQLPRALPAEHASQLLEGIDSMERGSPKTAYIYRDAAGEPTATAVVLENKDPDIGKVWLSSLTSLSEQGKGAGRQVMRDLKEKYGGVDGAMRPVSRGFYERIGARLDDDNGTFSYAKGGSVPQKFAGGGLALLRKALTGELAREAGTVPVIKQKGGNWLTGSVEGALSRLKKPAGNRGLPAEKVLAEMNQTYTPDVMFNLSPESLVTVQRSLADLRPKVALNNWIDKKLTKYVKNEMATPEDPVRALAERGVLHYEPDPAWIRDLGQTRIKAGFPASGLGGSELAKNWENISDSPVASYAVDDILSNREEPFRKKTIQMNPWLEKLNAENRVRDLTSSQNLGFDHLIDELSNAINPDSGLPRHLQFPADSLDKVTVPQAVERVSQINAWRAALKAEADQAKANNVATVLHKEYPENNPLGLRWVELKATGEPEGHSEEARKALADALKYEGDAMGHCVGGYCDDVVSGQSRIYSLRDAKGQPHVTIETSPYQGYFAKYDRSRELAERVLEVADPKELEEFAKAESSHGGSAEDFLADWADELGKYIEPSESSEIGLQMLEAVSPKMAKGLRDNMAKESILQIKGKQNKAPNPEYLPFVQDFVKSGKWQDVRDLENAGLILHQPSGKYISDADAAALAERHFGGTWGNQPKGDENPFQYYNRVKRYDPDMLSDTDKAFIADWEAGNFAHGGSV